MEKTRESRQAPTVGAEIRCPWRTPGDGAKEASELTPPSVRRGGRKIIIYC